MRATKIVTVRLDANDYEHLVSEAKRLTVSPAVLARSYVRAGLAGSNDDTGNERGRNGQTALEGLALLRERLPDAGCVDAVALVQEGRNALDRRMAL